MENKFLLIWVCGTSIFACSAMITHPYERSYNDGLLIRASSRGDLHIVRRAIAKGANNSAKNVACRCAAELCHLNVAQLLVDNGADIHDDDDYALQLATQAKHWDIVAYLLRKGANRAVLSFDKIISLIKSGATEFIPIELKISLKNDDWYQVENLLIAGSEYEWPDSIRKQIKNLLLPAVKNKLYSVRLVLFVHTQITNTDLASRTLSFMIGPHTITICKNLKK